MRRLLPLLALPGPLLFGSPNIDSISPPFWRPGSTNIVTITGNGLSAPRLWTSFGAQTRWIDTNDASRVTCQIVIPDQDAGIGGVRVYSTNGLSALAYVPLLDLPFHASESEISAPGVRAGIIRETAAVDRYALRCRERRAVHLEVLANRLGSALDPIIRILDAKTGREIAFADDFPFGARDARLTFTPPEPGAYMVEVRDAAFAGGDKHFYQLAATHEPLPALRFSGDPCFRAHATQSEKEPNDAIAAANRVEFGEIRGEFPVLKDRDFFRVTVAEKEQLWVRSRSRSMGSPCDLYLRLLKEDGSQIAASEISNTEDASVRAALNAPGDVWIEARELSGRGSEGFAYELEISRWAPGFTVTTEVDKLEAAPGSSATVAVTAARRDFDGEILLRVEGLPPGAEVEFGKIQAKKSDGELKLKMPENLEPGRLHELRVTAAAEWKGRELQSPVSALPAFRKNFPLMLYHPQHLAQVIHLGTKAK